MLSALVFLLPLSPCSSCAPYQVDWPQGKVESKAEQHGGNQDVAIRTFTLDGATKPNYEQRLEDGKVRELLFDEDGDGQWDKTVDLREPHPDWPHFLIILDGVPYDLVKKMRDEGQFRLFAPPARVVTVFPSVTDVALAQVFQSRPCNGFEAQYYDHEKKALSNGNDVYLSGANAPWQPQVTYCAPQSVAVNTYLSPWSVFSTELSDTEKLFRTTKLPFASAYSVGSAGIGTREGEAGIRRYLTQVDQLCERITFERRGQVHFSITADHGHSLHQCERVTYDKALADAGFNVVSSLSGPKDVVILSYGLVTCAQFQTKDPRGAAEAVLHEPSVDLVTFREGDLVYVLKEDAVATVAKRPGGYAYDTSKGDPLELAPILQQLKKEGAVDAEGTIADRPLLLATVEHKYPDPLRRLCECFDGIVLQEPDVVVSLRPEYCHGSAFFHFFVKPVASTHGNLDYLDSVTFVMTNALSKPLPSVMRPGDVLEAIGFKPKQ
jgi:hypothetical protein